MSNLLLNFPEGYTPNDTQVKILKKVEQAFSKGKKFTIINAPTGAGKTHISRTFGNVVRDIPPEFIDAVDDYSIFGESGPSLMENVPSFGSYALTITKALQDQYKSTFQETGVLKGQGNYICDLDENLTVDIAPCLYIPNQKAICCSQNRCPYYNQRNEMLKSKFSSLNYSMFFSLPAHLRKREIIICDEGSELEEQLVSQFTCEIDIPFLNFLNVSMTSLPVETTPTKTLQWLGNLNRGLSEKIEEYKDRIAVSKISEISKLRSDFTKLTNLQRSMEVLMGTYYDSQYLIERMDRKIKFIPLKVDKLAGFIFDNAEKVVIMSATIIDHKNFCKNLGIVDYEYIEVDSIFDPKKAPIYIMAKQKINYANLNSMLPLLAEQVEGLLKEHKHDKGIIHTHTQAIADYIRENVNDSRLLCRETGIRNEEILSEHENSDAPTVLVSPSMTYGVDLRGDLAKFQILLKAPWLPTKETRVSKMMALDKHWYSNKMLSTLVQACGRGIRSTTDECVTYILDGSIYDAIVKNKTRLPKFFLDRIN